MSLSPQPSNTLTSDEPLENLLFEYCGADIILRSHDLQHFRVPKSYIVNSSPVLDKLIQKTLNAPNDAQGEAALPVVQLPQSGALLYNLLTFVFPVTPLVPSTLEQSMELVSVAQAYQMASTLVHIRASIARQNSSSTQRRDTALKMYSLAQEYGLRQEALQAAQHIMKYPMNVEDMLELVQCSSLDALWKYFKKFRATLELDLKAFRASGGRGILAGLQCAEFSSSLIPRWLDDFIESIGRTPNLFDVFEFNTVLVRHISGSQNPICTCKFINSWTICHFWEALASVVQGSFEKEESALHLVKEREHSQTQVDSTVFLPEPLDLPDANIVIRSCDLVKFHVHKSILAMVSPFFRDLLSLPQPSDSETIDGLPVIQLSEDAELLNSLFSVLYPVRPVIPKSYEKVLDLLAACQKYDMVQVQSSIRAEVDRGAFPEPVGVEVFSAYAIARAKGLVPEMKMAARLSLDYPMTFTTLGDGLRLFEGWALRDLAHFRKRCRETLVTCLASYLDVQGPSSIWVGCHDGRSRRYTLQTGCIPSWLRRVLSQNEDSRLQMFTHPLTTSSNIRKEYMAALRNHDSCGFCFEVHVKKGSAFCTDLENKMALALGKVQSPLPDNEVPEDAPPVLVGVDNASGAAT